MRVLDSMLVVGAVVALGSGCARPPKPKYPHEVAEVALAQHRAQRSPIESMRAEARVDQRGRRGRIRGTVLMFVENPDRVRFDAMTQFGPAAVLTSDGEEFQLLDMREHRFLTGPTCPENIARLLGISLPAESVVRFLEGDSPRIDGVGEIETIRGGYRVTLSGADGSRQLLVFHIPREQSEAQPREQQLRLVESELRGPDGEVVFRAEYDDHREVELPRGGARVAMPFVLRFEDPRRGRDVLVRFKAIEPNVEPPDGAFSQPVPGGLAVERASCD